MKNLTAIYNTIFTAAHNVLASSPAWLAPVRENHLQNFIHASFDKEIWQYHNLQALHENPHAIAERTKLTLQPDFINPYRLKNTSSCLLTFVDGFLCPALSDLQHLPQGVSFTSINRALDTHEPLLRKYYLNNITPHLQPFASLNHAVFADGYFLNVPKDLKLEVPLHVLCIATDGLAQKNCNLNNYVHLAENSQVTIVEEYLNCTTTPYFNNIFTAITTEPSATLSHYKTQAEGANAIHIHNWEITQQAASQIKSHYFTQGAKIARDAVQVSLKEEYAGYTAHGIGLLNTEQTTDYHTRIQHSLPHCTSNVLFKNIVNANAQGIFNGLVVVEKDAIKTEAHLTNKNLLLDPTAIIHTSPELEIYADDVKCTHGATVGQLDKNALFYLCSRGIAAEDAKQLLIKAFIQEIIDTFPEMIPLNRFF